MPLCIIYLSILVVVNSCSTQRRSLGSHNICLVNGRGYRPWIRKGQPMLAQQLATQFRPCLSSFMFTGTAIFSKSHLLLHELAGHVQQPTKATRTGTATSTTGVTLEVKLECHLRCLSNSILLGSPGILVSSVLCLYSMHAYVELTVFPWLCCWSNNCAACPMARPINLF